MSAQKWYIVEMRVLGKGRWKRRGGTYPSKAHAAAYAHGQKAVPDGTAKNGSKALLYRIVPVGDA